MAPLSRHPTLHSDIKLLGGDRATLWSQHRLPNALLLRARNTLTLISTTVPTLALIGAATAVVALTLPPGAPPPAVTIALGTTVGVLYLAVVVILWQVVFGRGFGSPRPQP